MTTYRAVQATVEGKFELVELELTEPGPGQVRIAVEACGVCHSDVVGVHNLFGSRPAGTPIVPGHEIVGRIDKLGAESPSGASASWSASAISAATAVSARTAAAATSSTARTSRSPATRSTAAMRSTRSPGPAGLSQYRRSCPRPRRRRCCVRGSRCSTVCARAPREPGDLVAVQGIGGLGHLAIQYAAKLGFRVVAIARGEGKRELALKLGASEYIDSAAVDPAKALQELGGAQVIVATAASGASMTPLIDGLGLRGRLIVVGAATDPIEVSTGSLIFGGRSIHGSLTGTPSENEENLAFSLANDVRPMVEIVPLEEAGTAYERMMSGAARFRMVLTTTKRGRRL